MIDQFGVSTLIHEGWLEGPAVTGFTRRRYDRYAELLEMVDRHWHQPLARRNVARQRWSAERVPVARPSTPSWSIR
ncbi:hypothetical protein QMK17_16950 [Rhodococcus sp. G-MC3]|uniref:hypothetical protein n=1 Tax=Rhodococcus sp. G-MC3 TaxID=3046209 RepID=UPI0024BB40A3|nr:hypothetical protein [Rhodococcus sp. G-MC3]MDJ0395014.1 hypothetical protein [Rhodococcus sp. G-MC3]